MPSPPTETSTRHRSAGFGLALLCASSFIAVLDVTIVAIALPSIQRDLTMVTSEAQWILGGYALSFGGLLLVLGRAGDIYGRRRLLMLGLAVFAITSLLAGLAWSPWLLIAARVAQGIGGAALVPSSLALVAVTTAEGPARNRAVGLYSAMAGIGFVCGMLLGGVITEFLGWRWVFFVNVPVAVGVLAMAPAMLPDSRGEEAPSRLDLVGATTAMLGLAALLSTLTMAPTRGWASLHTICLGSLGFTLLLGFILVERHSREPLLPSAIVARPNVVVTNIAVALLSVVGVSQLFVLTLYYQNYLGHGPLTSGLLFLPMTLASVIASPCAGRLTTRWGTRRTTVLGFAILATGLLLTVWNMGAHGAIAAVIAGTVAAEAGFMTARVPLTITATEAAEASEQGLVSGILNTSGEVGNAFGWATVAAVLAATGAGSGGSALLEGLRWSLALAIGMAVAALLAVLVFVRECPETAPGAGTGRPAQTPHNRRGTPYSIID